MYANGSAKQAASASHEQAGLSMSWDWRIIGVLHFSCLGDPGWTAAGHHVIELDKEVVAMGLSNGDHAMHFFPPCFCIFYLVMTDCPPSG